MKNEEVKEGKEKEVEDEDEGKEVEKNKRKKKKLKKIITRKRCGKDKEEKEEKY